MLELFCLILFLKKLKFSNKLDAKIIAKLIQKKCDEQFERIQANKEIIENGFDMMETAEGLLEHYIKCCKK